VVCSLCYTRNCFHGAGRVGVTSYTRAYRSKKRTGPTVASGRNPNKRIANILPLTFRSSAEGRVAHCTLGVYEMSCRIATYVCNWAILYARKTFQPLGNSNHVMLFQTNISYFTYSKPSIDAWPNVLEFLLCQLVCFFLISANAFDLIFHLRPI